MKKIRRKTLLYKTGVEYGDYTINLALGCAHGCKYPCYAYLMAKRFGTIKSYEEWVNPKIIENTLELLKNELNRMSDKIKNVQLCFTTDPFMLGNKEIKELSLKAINLINSYGIPCRVLTKGILPHELLETSKINEYGISLISLNEKFRSEYEPNSATYLKRINSLKKLSNAGFKTWVSIEPYPTPNIIEQDLNKILSKVSFANKIIFGRWHYNKIISSYSGYKKFYNECSCNVIAFCNNNNINYHIKKGTITDE